ncbi:MAG: hydroxymethylglutaryl-CoA lyase [Alphaproteobacteria bacterium]|nr:hydroxymethylglutaryl-CoA lyase [Alphaproteobacteria bacterium]
MNSVPTPDFTIVDVSARDGLQNEANAAQLTAADKVTFIRGLAASGLTRIEAGSFVHPKVAAMANSDEVAALLAPVAREFPAVVFSYLTPNLKGLARAQAIGAKEVAIFLALSEEFSKANINQTVDEAFAAITPVVAAARASGIRVRGYLSNVFGYTDLPFNPTLVAERSAELLAMGCFEVSLGDTTALATPEMTAALIAALNARGVPLANIALHFHDTHGRAISNVAQAYALGIRTFDAATGGLGGCPYAKSPKGNLALEDLLHWADAQGLRTAVTNREALAQARRFIHEKLGKTDHRPAPGLPLSSHRN